MDNLFGYSKKFLELNNGYITAKEIHQQPRLWRETIKLFKDNYSEISSYMQKIDKINNLRIIITGAGTSAFVGDTVVPYLKKTTRHNIEAIATTDIVSHPDYFYKKDVPTLLISCARSGNSPESVAAVELAEKIVDELYQISLTCNPSGKLAKKMEISDNNLFILMPKDANDQGFAMTGSYTTMTLSAILLFDLNSLDKYSIEIEKVSLAGVTVLDKYFKVLKEIVKKEARHIVYLGAANLLGLARESSLKFLELCAGKKSVSYDSPLGFRHGPKSILSNETVVIVYLSPSEYSRKYDLDILKEMYSEGGSHRIVAVTDFEDKRVKEYCHDYIVINEGIDYQSHDSVLYMLDYVLIAQMYALINSLESGITPDNPCPSGSVNRVVQGVVIYPYED